MNGLIRKLIKSLGMKWLTGQVRAAAEGKLGPRWEAIYWGLAGKKRWISLIVGILAGATALAGYTHVAEAIATAATAGLSLGFVDLNWRSAAQEDWLKDSWLWKLLANNAPVVTAGLLLVLGWLQGTTCTLGEWCGYGSILVSIVGASLVQIGVVDAAWNAPAPQ
jgi:hypothetical protein